MGNDMNTLFRRLIMNITGLPFVKLVTITLLLLSLTILSSCSDSEPPMAPSTQAQDVND